MTTQEISKWALVLETARQEGREIERLTLQSPNLTLDDAYRIQDHGIALRTSKGEKVLGFKMGLTSRAKREQMNLTSPIYGVLTDRMKVPASGLFSLKGTIHPKIEPEIAFFIGRTLQGKQVTEAEILDSCTGVAATMEILDSRFLNFKYFSLPDVVADNCSSAYYVVSEKIEKPTALDLANLRMVMSVDGKPVQEAVSNAISGNPVNSVFQLYDMLSSRGLPLPAGSVVLAGAATQAVPLVAGTEVSLAVEGLGRVSIQVGA